MTTQATPPATTGPEPTVNNVKKDFAERLVASRELSGSSLRVVARKIGVTPAAVSNWEHAVCLPTEATARKLMKWLPGLRGGCAKIGLPAGFFEEPKRGRAAKGRGRPAGVKDSAPRKSIHVSALNKIARIAGKALAGRKVSA